MSKTLLISINTSWNIHNFRASLVRAIKAQGYQVISVAPDDHYTNRLRTLVDEHIALPMDNAGTSFARDLGLWWRYIALLRATKPAIMLTYTIKPNIYGSFAARACNVPVIANVSGLGTAFIRDSWLTAIVKMLYRQAFRSVAHVFFQNADDRDLFIQMKLVAPEKTSLLPGSGVDLNHFKPSDAALNPQTPLSFVLIARLLWDKGIGEFVEAARIIKAQHPHVIFRLVGPRGVKNKTAIADQVIEQWVSEGTIEYLGEMDDIRGPLAQSDCVVLPSYREGLSRVLLEAAAMGKPLIASDVPGCKQVIDHGKNGLLCQPRNAKSLAETMQQFIALSPPARDEMGRASRMKAEQEFDEQKVIDAYLTKIAALAK